MYEWNPVFNWLIGIKNEYITRYGGDDADLYGAGEYRSYVDKWVNALYGHDHSNANMRLLRCLICNTTGAVVNLHYNTIAISKIGGLAFPELSKLEAYAAMWSFDGGFLQKCRSICLDMEHEEIVIAAYDKFFNLNEMPWTRLSDVNDAIGREMEKEESERVLEVSDKLDGSYIAASWHYGRNAAGLSSSGQFDNGENLHIKIAKEYLNVETVKMITENKRLSFMFELLDPRIPVVVRYPDSMYGLHLIGIRDKTTGETYTYRRTAAFGARYGVRAAAAAELTDLDALVARAAEIGGVEGWVLNVGGRRYKVKCKEYFELSHILMGDVVGANVVKCYYENTADDFVSILPTDMADEFFAKMDIVKRYEENELRKLGELFPRADKSSRAAFAKWCFAESIRGGTLANMFMLMDGKEPCILYKTYGKERKYLKFSDIEELGGDIS